MRRLGADTILRFDDPTTKSALNGIMRYVLVRGSFSSAGSCRLRGDG